MSTDQNTNPLARIIESQGFLVLDGGLATSLETAGHDLNDDLWSAKVLLEEPGAIKQAHLDFLRAGADCIATASYQASFPGFRRRGLSDSEIERLLHLSVDLAVEARDAFWADHTNRPGRQRPLVAASIGPYGAFLADGSEYKGRYELGDEGLREFHEDRWRLLAESRADLLACETIPSRREAGVLRALIRETPGAWGWMSFSCRDGKQLSDGTRLEDVARDCDVEPRLAALGINCTHPEFIESLIGEARRGTTKPILVYPNQGEGYDPVTKTWTDAAQRIDWHQAAAGWAQLGAAGVGGCCRVGPEDLVALRAGLQSRASGNHGN
jgi:homocysteine S-methyltransferase